jgi:hypothetical protein
VASFQSVYLVGREGDRIASLPNMPFEQWEEGHLVSHESVVYVVRHVHRETQLGSGFAVLLTVERARV